MKALSELPPFSPVLDRLLATLSSETVSIAKISDIIETDTVIAGNVLKIVNSALYGRRGTVNSVRHAVSLLGINKLRNTVFALSIGRVWNHVRTAPGWSTKRFNLHSVACALLCDALAQRVSINYAEGAFAAGLFHDLGALLIAVGLPDEHAQVERLVAARAGSRAECERQVIGVSHADLSAEALAVWNLPAAIQTAVRYHHECQDAGRSEGVSLALAVKCSNDYVNRAGLTLLKDEEPEQGWVEEPFAPLGMELAHADFVEEFKAELELLGGVFH